MISICVEEQTVLPKSVSSYNTTWPQRVGMVTAFMMPAVLMSRKDLQVIETAAINGMDSYVNYGTRYPAKASSS